VNCCRNHPQLMLLTLLFTFLVLTNRLNHRYIPRRHLRLIPRSRLLYRYRYRNTLLSCTRKIQPDISSTTSTSRLITNSHHITHSSLPVCTVISISTITALIPITTIQEHMRHPAFWRQVLFSRVHLLWHMSVLRIHVQVVW
jgi:hypothetical protein